jgi:nicotinate-nucleotide adenylyltransferase
VKRPATLAGVLGLFGGTFDPVHIGHLRTAYELRLGLGIDRIHFIPAAVPPHRVQPVASAGLRVQMLEAALASETDSIVDCRELDRAGPSYTVDTAASLRAEFPDHALCLLLGMDAFLGLPEWRDWERLLSLVNIVVARRPGAQLPDSGSLGGLLAANRVGTDSAVCWETAGQIIVRDVTQLEVSATDLRASIRAGIAPKYLVPDAAWNIIATSGCYAGDDERP